MLVKKGVRVKEIRKQSIPERLVSWAALCPHEKNEEKGGSIQMVKISDEVRSGAARFDVAVQAETIQRAMSLVRSDTQRAASR